MATGGQRRTRAERIAALGIAPGQWERAWASLRQRDVLARIGVAAMAAALLSLIIQGWNPPLPYRTGDTPPRNIVARVSFTRPDEIAFREAVEQARGQVRRIYVQDATPLEQLRSQLRNTMVELAGTERFEDFEAARWAEFLPPARREHPPPNSEEQQALFDQLRTAAAGPDNLDRFEAALATALALLEQQGVLRSLDKTLGPGNEQEIIVYPAGHEELQRVVRVSEVLLGDGSKLRERLRHQFEPPGVADALFNWLHRRLEDAATLRLDEARSRKALDEAVAAVEPRTVDYVAGTSVLAEADKPLDSEAIHLLTAEYAAYCAARPVSKRLLRALTVALVAFALFVLCGVYMRYRQRGPLASVVRLNVMLLLAIITVALCRVASHDAWRAELVPLMLFGMTMAIVHRQELGLLLSAVTALLVVFAIGHGLPEFLLLVGVTTTAVLNMGRIRGRSKLIYVGLAAGGVAFLINLAMAVLDNQPFGSALLNAALRDALWATAAGFLMTGLLPFIEKTFGVLTDLSLLELGDVAHPLLQELVRRAPSTYNHSVTVGSIAEAAAESIGARGLLCRVGAYFHDIGKMLKPGYFIENQRDQQNRHETLVPAMSTLVIVAHIKDGADLGRQYRLPQPIVDLIEQHHGTTRVGFFFERASEQQKANPDAGQVDEKTYRYPGPKPQTKEAGVLMLADAVESASRTLVDPTPARIESLVRSVAERRLHDGQFDESGLTLRELRTIERSLVMSLTAIYHGRLKYPDQQTA
ncbi:MAG: HDIG domain-containing protein [Thermoguttaceae bacterium]|jgi:putative nucleotidyltransferase with HDIG domain|nr:HDIG domain-containing protein [Thermoguttaceae bacterium]